MPRFAILEHDWPNRHWDLFLEAGKVLRTWRLLAEPLPGTTVPAEPIGDHRKMYLDYEGPVSGNRGRVVRLASGTFDWIADTENRVAVRLSSAWDSGLLELKQLANGTWQCDLVAELLARRASEV